VAPNAVRGVVMVHMTRIPNVDATDPVQLTHAELEGRRQVREYHRFLRDRVAGFEGSVVVATGPSIGVRESRRVFGDYRLTRDDVLGARRFDDEIALCGAPIEDHHAGGDTEWRYVAGGGVYGIKLFPASAVGPAFVRELRGPMPEVELIPTGGIDGANAAAFLQAGAVAVGIGSALGKADAEARRQIIRAL
jgi:hypothetical protein